MSALRTLIAVTSTLFVKILRAHTPVRVRQDIQGMEKHVMVSEGLCGWEALAMLYKMLPCLKVFIFV